MADISEVTVIEKKEDGTIVTTTTYDIKDEIAREQLSAIPSKTSDLQNDSNYITASEAPVQSVNGQTGAVTISAEGLSEDAKNALIDCFRHVAWIDSDGTQYVNALISALYELQSITAVYTQSGTVYDTDSLDDLKTDLVVTAHYKDGTTETVTAYTLSGTLEEGTSTITVSYGGKTTTFNVTVTTAQYIFATQGNDFIKNPTTATNRCSIRVKNRRVAQQDTLSVSCVSGYSVFQYVIEANPNASDDGTLNSNETRLGTKIVADNGDVVNSVSGMVTPSNSSKTWVEEGVTSIHNTYTSNGLTIGVIGFVIKKTDDSDITPQEAINAVVVTGHTPLETV